MTNETDTETWVAEIEARLADRDDSRAMNSACGEYNCPCHYDLPLLLDERKELKVEIERLSGRPWCGAEMERIPDDGSEELGCTSERCPSFGIGVWCYAESLRTALQEKEAEADKQLRRAIKFNDANQTCAEQLAQVNAALAEKEREIERSGSDVINNIAAVLNADEVEIFTHLIMKAKASPDLNRRGRTALHSETKIRIAAIQEAIEAVKERVATHQLLRSKMDCHTLGPVDVERVRCDEDKDLIAALESLKELK